MLICHFSFLIVPSPSAFCPLIRLASGLAAYLFSCMGSFPRNESAPPFINSTFVVFSDSLISTCLHSVLLPLD